MKGKGRQVVKDQMLVFRDKSGEYLAGVHIVGEFEVKSVGLEPGSTVEFKDLAK